MDVSSSVRGRVRPTVTVIMTIDAGVNHAQTFFLTTLLPSTIMSSGNPQGRLPRRQQQSWCIILVSACNISMVFREKDVQYVLVNCSLLKHGLEVVAQGASKALELGIMVNCCIQSDPQEISSIRVVAVACRCI